MRLARYSGVRGYGAFGVVSMPVVQRNDKGTAVEKLQQLLKAALGAGWAPETDGVGFFGPRTEAAVLEFQKKQGLKVDGIVGGRTWAALGIPATAPVGAALPAATTAAGGSVPSEVVPSGFLSEAVVLFGLRIPKWSLVAAGGVAGVGLLFAIFGGRKRRASMPAPAVAGFRGAGKRRGWVDCTRRCKRHPTVLKAEHDPVLRNDYLNYCRDNCMIGVKVPGLRGFAGKRCK